MADLATMKRILPCNLVSASLFVFTLFLFLCFFSSINQYPVGVLLPSREY